MRGDHSSHRECHASTAKPLHALSTNNWFVRHGDTQPPTFLEQFVVLSNQIKTVVGEQPNKSISIEQKKDNWAFFEPIAAHHHPDNEWVAYKPYPLCVQSIGFSLPSEYHLSDSNSSSSGGLVLP